MRGSWWRFQRQPGERPAWAGLAGPGSHRSAPARTAPGHRAAACAAPAAGARRISAGDPDLEPQTAVEVEVVAVGLAGAAVADIGVERMAVVGHLRGAVGPPDGAEPARDTRPSPGVSGNRRPVRGARPGAFGN